MWATSGMISARAVGTCSSRWRARPPRRRRRARRRWRGRACVRRSSCWRRAGRAGWAARVGRLRILAGLWPPEAPSRAPARGSRPGHGPPADLGRPPRSERRSQRRPPARPTPRGGPSPRRGRPPPAWAPTSQPATPAPMVDQRHDSLGVLDGRVERDHAADGVADQAGAADAERVEDGDDVGPVREGHVLGHRGTAAATVEGHDAVAGIEQVGGQGLPGPRVHDARVEQDDGRAAAEVVHRQPATGYVDEAFAHGGSVSRPAGSGEPTGGSRGADQPGDSVSAERLHDRGRRVSAERLHGPGDGLRERWDGGRHRPAEPAPEGHRLDADTNEATLEGRIAEQPGQRHDLGERQLVR